MPRGNHPPEEIYLSAFVVMLCVFVFPTEVMTTLDGVHSKPLFFHFFQAFPWLLNWLTKLHSKPLFFQLFQAFPCLVGG